MTQLTKVCDASMTQERVTWTQIMRQHKHNQPVASADLTALGHVEAPQGAAFDYDVHGPGSRWIGGGPTCISNAAYAGLTECRGMQFVRRDFNNKMRQQAPAFVIFALLLMSIVCNHLCAMRGTVTQMGSVPIPPAALAERVQSRICEMIEEWQR